MSGSAWLVMRLSSRSCAISSTRARRDSRSSSRRGELDGGQSAVGEARRAGRRARPDRRRRRRAPRRRPEPGLADELGSRAVGRDDGEDRTARRDVLEDLPGEDALASAARIGHEQEQRLRVALEAQRLRPGQVVDELETVAEVERLAPIRGPTSGSRRRSAQRRRGRRRGTPAGTAAGRGGRRSCPCA